MSIRLATIEDVSSIRNLIEQLDYSHTQEFIREKVERLLASSCDEVYLYEDNGQVLGLISVNYTIQLAFEDDFCNIGYFIVDANSRGKQIGKQLDEYICERAKERGCRHIEVFSQAKRKDAHRFYERQGYKVMEKYFGKELSVYVV